MFKEGVYQFPPEKPGIDEDVDALIKERDDLFKQLKYPEEIKSMIQQIENYLMQFSYSSIPEYLKVKEQIFQKHLQNAIRRIVHSTEINKELGKLMNFELLMDWPGHKKQVGDIQDDLVLKGDGSGLQGAYSKKTKEIFLTQEAYSYLNDPKLLLFVLALQGAPEKFGTYWHERVHSHQFPGKVEAQVLQFTEYLMMFFSVFLGSYGAGLVGKSSESVFGGAIVGGAIFKAASLFWEKNKMKRFSENKSLIETQAYTATLNSDDVMEADGVVNILDRHSPTIIELIKHFQTEAYRMICPDDCDRIIMAYEQLGRLRALGLPEMEIAKLVKRAKWDQKKLQFNTLQERIDRECKKRNIDPLDLDTMRDLSHIKRTILVYQIKLIAQDEIRRALLSLQKEHERLLAEKNDKK